MSNMEGTYHSLMIYLKQSLNLAHYSPTIDSSGEEQSQNEQTKTI